MDIALSSYLNPSGLSWVAQEYFKCFTDYGLRVVPVWLLAPELDVKFALDPAIADSMMRASEKPLEGSPLQFHAGRADAVKVVKNNAGLVASIVLEGNALNEDHSRIVKAVDAVLVPSYFCRNVCASSGVPREKLFQVLYALDQKAWNPQVKPLVKPGDRFRFLYMNTWYERKGWDVLLRAWWQEFTADDPVELIIKSYRENDRTEPVEVSIAVLAAQMGIDRSKKAPIKVVDHLLPATMIPSFMKSFNAYVTPHRSEGFGFNPWYAMALEVPVICTDYGGNTDFCKSDTSWLVRPEKMTKPSEKEASIFPHLANTTWAEPSVNELRHQMRMCSRYPDEAARRARCGSQLVHEAYNYKKVMCGFENALKSRLPGVWEKLCLSRQLESLTNQPSERFESPDKPLTMVEI